MEEKKQGSVDVIEFDSAVIMELLRFMYVGQVHEIEKVDLKLYEAAKVYMVENLQTICVKAMEKRLNVENFIEITEFADLHDETELYKSCMLLMYR